MKNLMYLCLGVFLVSCFGAKNPEDLLSNILQERQKNTLSKSYLQKHSTGKLLETLNEMDDTAFSSYNSSFGIKGGNFKILSKNCDTETTCTLTYILKFNSTESKEVVFKSEVKKVAKLTKEDGTWKLSEMMNVKTYHESMEPIDTL